MMATYQGEKYLNEQLDSIIGQSFTNWELYISDDGSTDSTMHILQRYKEMEPRIVKIISNHGEHGAFSNFFSLMRYVKENVKQKYNFYFYCDQDDIWYKDKLEKQIDCMLKYKKESSSSIPVLCYSDLQLMDGKGNMLGRTLGQDSDISLENYYNIFFAERYIWGTTMAHDAVLWEMTHVPMDIPGFLSHDNWIGRYAAVYGKIIFMNEPLVCYRRHGGNVTADVPHGYTFWQGIKRIFTQLPDVLDNHAGTYWASLYFIAHLNDKKKTLIDFEKCLLNGGWQAVKIVRKYNINTAENFFNRAAFFLILFTSIYKRSKVFNHDFRN